MYFSYEFAAEVEIVGAWREEGCVARSANAPVDQVGELRKVLCRGLAMVGEAEVRVHREVVVAEASEPVRT